MDDPRKSFEFRQLEQADKLRIIVVGLFAVLALCAPSSEVRNAPLALVLLSIGAVYALFTRFIVDWHKVRAEGRVHLMAAFLVVADVLLMTAFIMALGPAGRGLSVLLLLEVVFAAAFFPGLEPALMVGIVSVCYALLGLSSATGHTTWQVMSSVSATVVLGWMAYALSEVGRRERAMTSNIVRHLTEGVFMVARDGRILVVNPRAEHMFGVRASDLLGLDFRDPANARALAPVREALADAANGECSADIRVRDIQVQAPNPLDIQCVTVPCATESGDVVAWVVVCRDVTETYGVVRVKQEGFAVLAHELRGRLNALTATAEILATAIDDIPASARNKAFQILESSTRRLMAVAAKILDATALENNGAAFDFQPVSLPNIAEQVCTCFEGVASAKGVELSLRVEGEVPLVNGDPARLDQVLHNLLDNALRYTHPGGHVRLTVSSREGMVHVSVADDGPGIAPERKDVIFEKFVHGMSGKEAYTSGGIGIGLYLCREVIRRHGGKISAQNNPEGGALFTFTLPAMVTEARSLQAGPLDTQSTQGELTLEQRLCAYAATR